MSLPATGFFRVFKGGGIRSGFSPKELSAVRVVSAPASFSTT